MQRGRYYQARYAAQNQIGYSEWSDTTFIFVAGVPQTPKKPTYISSTATSITLGIIYVDDDNGAAVDRYEIYKDGGNFTSTVSTLVSGYNGNDPQFTVTGLTPGVIYRFGLVAVNKIGPSQMSNFSTFASASNPSKPTIITKDSSFSSKTSIMVSWPKVSDTEVPVSGYIL